MRPNDRAQSAAPAVPNRLARVFGVFRRAPLPLEIGFVLLALIFFAPETGALLLAARAYGVYGVVKARRTVLASVCVAVWGLVGAGVAGISSSWIYLLLVMPFAIAAGAHIG